MVGVVVGVIVGGSLAFVGRTTIGAAAVGETVTAAVGVAVGSVVAVGAGCVATSTGGSVSVGVAWRLRGSVQVQATTAANAAAPAHRTARRCAGMRVFIGVLHATR